MEFRLQKRICIFKGSTPTLSKSSTSCPVRGPGAPVSLREHKVTPTVGAPGTALSYRH
jgi:hypothetical protein